MASNTDFVQYIVDQCSDAGEISVKKNDGRLLHLLRWNHLRSCLHDKLFIKPTYQGAAQMKELVMRSPYPGAKEHFLVTNVDGITLRVYLQTR